MRISGLFGKTLREDPTEAETASHRFMLRAGMIYQVASGVYAYMPLAYRSLRKIEKIIREEMDTAGCQEVKMPALQPLELWEETGRAIAFGDSLFSFQDRRQRKLVLAPTHEEVITKLVRANLESYRDLPLIIYQIQTKFRDEPRPRGGLIRVREFDMKDAYSFDLGEIESDISYRRMAEAYRNIYRRCGLPVLEVEADSGAIGGKDSQEFILPTNVGEDTVLFCQTGHYSANVEKASCILTVPPNEEELPIEEVATPDVKTIHEVAGYLNVEESKVLKSVFYSADGRLALVTIRGDLEVNEVKLKNILNSSEVRLATDEEILNTGSVAGYVSPVGLKGILNIADKSIQIGSNFIVGANKSGYHLANVNYPRDFVVDVIKDVVLVRDGYGCPLCNAPLDSTRGIEVGHIFKLGTSFSEKLGATYVDQEGNEQPVMMGCYGIGIGRLLAAAIEQNHDERGIIFPVPIAPYQIYLIVLNSEDLTVRDAANELYKHLLKKGFEVLYDDRYEAAGVKFADADLMGIPVRVVISSRTIRGNSVEVKVRSEGEATLVLLEDTIQFLRGLLREDT
jgi:prolyl-tRNA synthetase